MTGLLQAWSRGDLQARDRLMTLVYDELRRQAARYLRRERAGHSLQPTALVHEVYLRLAGQPVAWQNRAHFFAVAAQAMRHILVDHARRRAAVRRGGDQTRVVLADEVAAPGGRELELLALDRCLNELAALDEQQARMVELRFFGGLSIEEAAEVLGISAATVKREWNLAKAWLYRCLGPASRPTG